MFLAGQESDRPLQTRSRAIWLWPAATFSMTGLAACFAIALGLQLARPPQERIIVREVPAALPQQTIAPALSVPTVAQAQTSAPLPSFPASSLLQMRNVALRFGVEALPSEQAVSSSSSPPLSPIEPWQQLRAAPANSDSSL
jgi:hypothetical protein